MSIPLDHLNIDKETLKRILDFLPYPFLVSETKQGKRYTIFVNEKFLEEIGYTCEEIPTNEDWFITAYPDPVYRQKVKEEWNARSAQALIKEKDSVFMQAFIHTKRSADRWYEVKSSLSGNIHLVAFIDINDVRAREEELERTSRNKDKILSILGHDLRGPIHNLQSLSNLMLQTDMKREEFLLLVKTVNDMAFQSLEFLDTTLIWTKSNFDKISIHIEKLAPKALVESILPVYVNLYENKKIAVTLNINPVITIYADAEILTIVIRNLISNAIKFTHENGQISIGTEQQGDFFIIFIKDTGIGMDKETQARIMDENYASSKGTQQEKGLGLGLKLCKELLKQVGGALEIESEQNVGTTMKIKLKNNLPDY